MAKNIYERWDTRVNPAATLMTNTYVNYYAGISITQTTPSATHILPNSFDGKQFHVNNEGLSTFNVSVQANTQNGIETFNIKPGDSGIFGYIGNGIWDQIGGEQIIRDLIDSSATTKLSRIINFNDAPDVFPATYHIGTIPTGYSAYQTTIEIDVPFNDFVVDTAIVKTVSGPTILMDTYHSDIKLFGIYSLIHSSTTAPIDGLVYVEFNADPDGSGGTQGQMGVSVEYRHL